MAAPIIACVVGLKFTVGWVLALLVVEVVEEFVKSNLVVQIERLRISTGGREIFQSRLVDVIAIVYFLVQLKEICEERYVKASLTGSILTYQSYFSYRVISNLRLRLDL